MSENNIDKPKPEYGITNDDAYKNLERVNSWIGNVDNKISFALAFAGVLIGLLFTSDEATNYIQKCIIAIMDLGFSEIKTYFSILSLIIITIMLYFIVKGLIYLLKGLKASYNIEQYKDDDVILDSQLFWGTISSKKFSDFNCEFTNLTERDLLNDINSQTYINSVICTKKFRNYNIGINNIKWAVILFIVMKVLMYINVWN